MITGKVILSGGDVDSHYGYTVIIAVFLRDGDVHHFFGPLRAGADAAQYLFDGDTEFCGASAQTLGYTLNYLQCIHFGSYPCLVDKLMRRLAHLCVNHVAILLALAEVLR